ncbi:MAG: DUF6266 family protein [Bacteroidota bacterium]
MARLNKGPNGPASGKFGSVIGSSWRGIYYIKGLQKKITKARSPLQIAQQNKFAFAVKFLRPVKSLVDMGFSRVNPGGATGYNMAISHVVQHSIKGTDPDFEIDYQSVMFCTKGKLFTPETINMELDGLDLEVTWSIERGVHASPADSVELLIFQPGTFEYQIIPESIKRGDGSLKIKLDSRYQGDTVHVYYYLKTASTWLKEEWSNSVYLGPVKFRD